MYIKGLSQTREGASNYLTLLWSTGPVEGHINRVKGIKRDLYGRAGVKFLPS